MVTIFPIVFPRQDFKNGTIPYLGKASNIKLQRKIHNPLFTLKVKTHSHYNLTSTTLLTSPHLTSLRYFSPQTTNSNIPSEVILSLVYSLTNLYLEFAIFNMSENGSQLEADAAVNTEVEVQEVSSPDPSSLQKLLSAHQDYKFTASHSVQID